MIAIIFNDPSGYFQNDIFMSGVGVDGMGGGGPLTRVELANLPKPESYEDYINHPRNRGALSEWGGSDLFGTMERFEAWANLNHEKVYQISSFPDLLKPYTDDPFDVPVKGIDDPRYVRSHCGDQAPVVDMRHFIMAGRTKSLLYGELIEYYQALREQYESAFHPQDYYSNYMGVDFFKNYYDSKSPETIGTKIRQYLESRYK